MTDARFAADLAEKAGALLVELRAAGGDPKELGKRGDAAANTLLVEAIRAQYPDDAILSEESQDTDDRAAAQRVWIVDPLDGTREYGLGRDDWAVHVGLWEAQGGLTAAAVAQPAIGAVYATDDVSAASRTGAVRIAVSASRAPSFIADVAADLGGETVPMGSAGVKTLAVLRGEVDAYVHAGGQWEWDSAAPVGVAQAAGLHCSRIDGSPLLYNQPHPYLPDLVVCRAGLATRLLAAIENRTGGTSTE